MTQQILCYASGVRRVERTFVCFVRTSNHLVIRVISLQPSSLQVGPTAEDIVAPIFFMLAVSIIHSIDFQKKNPLQKCLCPLE